MSYKDLEEARAKRAAKEKATASKGKRGRKRKSPAPEVEPEAEVLRMSEVPEPAKALVAPWRALVARMY